MKVKNKLQPISLSFKNEPEDIKLYIWIKSHSGQSAFIKDILKEKMSYESKNSK